MFRSVVQRLAPTALLACVLLAACGRARPANDADVTFARDMMAHHGQAVEMSLHLRERTRDEALRTLTLDILLTQQQQIGQMHGWLSAWGVPITGPQAPMQGHAERMGMATRADVNALQTLPLAEAEVSFLKLMIRHHEGGTLMAQDAIYQAARDEVKTLARAILTSQTEEVAYMRTLLELRGIAAPEPALSATPGHH